MSSPTLGSERVVPIHHQLSGHDRRRML